MVSINGKGPLFGFNGDKKVKGKEPAKVNNDVPVGKSQEVKQTSTDYGDKLLTQGFYPGLNLSTSTNLNINTVTGMKSSEFIWSLNELQGVDNDLASLATGVDADKLARHMKQPLNDTVASGLEEYMKALA